jgi:hypothetical protein
MMHIAVDDSSSKVAEGLPEPVPEAGPRVSNAEKEDVAVSSPRPSRLEKENATVSKPAKDSAPPTIKEASKPPPVPPVLPLRAYNSEGAAKTSQLPARIEDPFRGYRIPARTKVSMTELLNRMGCRSPACSPVAFKNSKRVLGKIVPLHPTRRTPPPPPPRVVRVEKKTKAQRDEEALWEEEWEEQYGEAWYEMSEEDKERLRRERRDQLWIED